MGFDRKFKRKPAPPNDAPAGASRQRVRVAWESFERAILPQDCSEVQRTETRRAFYAGAFCIMDELAKAMSHEDEMTDSDEQVMIDLEIERQQYLINLGLGRA
jgi:hypothetical protein